MKNIKYNNGSLERISKDYFNLTLLNANNKIVYKATIDNLTACIILDKSKKIKLINN